MNKDDCLRYNFASFYVGRLASVIRKPQNSFYVDGDLKEFGQLRFFYMNADCVTSNTRYVDVLTEKEYKGPHYRDHAELVRVDENCC